VLAEPISTASAGSYQDIIKQLDVSIINMSSINLTARVAIAGGRESAPAYNMMYSLAGAWRPPPHEHRTGH